MKYDMGKWIGAWDCGVLRDYMNLEAQRPLRKRAMVTRVGGHCALCASYIRQDAGLTSLRAKASFLPSLKARRPLADRLLIDRRRTQGNCGHSNKFKKL